MVFHPSCRGFIRPGKGLPYRYAFTVSAMPDAPHGLFSAIARFDVQTGDMQLRDFAPGNSGEPVMVPRPSARDEDDGWLLTVVYHGSEHRSALYVCWMRATCRRSAWPSCHITFRPVFTATSCRLRTVHLAGTRSAGLGRRHGSCDRSKPAGDTADTPCDAGGPRCFERCPRIDKLHRRIVASRRVICDHIAVFVEAAHDDQVAVGLADRRTGQLRPPLNAMLMMSGTRL